MRALLLLMLAFTLSTPGYAGTDQSSTSQNHNALTSMSHDLNSPRDGVRYKAARRFFAGVKGLKEQNPSGLNQGDAQYQDLRDLVERLYDIALYDADYVRVPAIKGLRQVIDLELLPDPADRHLVLSIWLDILHIAQDPLEPKAVRAAAGGPL
jgi:hypothetical protein